MVNIFSRRFILLLFIIIVACEIKTSEVPRPRGVPLSRAPLYAAGKEFVCLDGSLTIPFLQVNDNYCDCPDGSDEPGTSACPHGMFYCTNAGHKPLNIPSARVNDGICDCCDASDEYDSPNSNCINNCNELGRSARAEAQKKAELVKLGSQVRAELSQKGILLKQEKKEKLLVLNRNRNEAEQVHKEKETLKAAVEELESVALQQYHVFDRFDSNLDGKLEISELQTRPTFDRDRDGQITEDEARYFLDENSDLEFEEFLTVAWPKIKPFIMLEAGATPNKPQYDEETQKLIDQANEARDQFNNAEKTLRDIQNEIKNIEESLQKDYGLDEEFAVLDGQCFEYADREYVYKLCPFDQVIQKPKAGGSDTRLGTWGSWVGTEQSKYDVMLYDRGQSCWNGPQRSTHVRVICGSENAVMSVAEPNRCEYVMDFITPAACNPVLADKASDDTHDEL
ncbi:Glucosidase 2 beta subunit [Carabus blaptoides fortunei]